MKLLLNLFILSFITLACDQPVKTRVPSATNYQSGTNNFNNTGQGIVQEEESGTDVNTGSGSNNGSNTEVEFDHCPYLSPEHNGGALGNFGLCQGANDERRFKTIFSQANTNGTCFVPIHILSNGNSFKLGRAECVHNKANTNYYMTLYKEKVAPYFTYARPEAVNGVMVIGASSLNSYMGCMNGKEDYYIGTQGCCYSRRYNSSTNRYSCVSANPQCENAANNYATNICQLFVQNHSSNYRQVNFD